MELAHNQEKAWKKALNIPLSPHPSCFYLSGLLSCIFPMALSTFFVAAAVLTRVAAGMQAPVTTYISGSWFFGLASCGGKAFTPFNFTANECAPLDTADLQGQFKGNSLRLKQPDASRAIATLIVFSDASCSVQPTNWGSVADDACQMSYWSTKYTFFTNFTTVAQ